MSVTLNPCVDHTLFTGRLALHDRNVVLRTETDAGGKGVNLSRVAAELDVETSATGFLGGDAGQFVSAVLAKQAVDNKFYPIPGQTRTNISVESGDGPPTVFAEKGPQVSKEDWDRFLHRFESLAKDAHWVALGGSLPPGLPDEAYRDLLLVARDKGARVLLDADGGPMKSGLLAKPDMVKPNRDEATRLLAKDIRTLDEARKAAIDIRAQLSDLGVAIVSMGSMGAAMAFPGGSAIAHGVAVQARSTIGSGDSLLGAVLARSCHGDDWPTCLRWGTASGAATAESNGSDIGRRPEIERLLPQVRLEL